MHIIIAFGMPRQEDFILEVSRGRPVLKSNTNKKNKLVEENRMFSLYLAIDRKGVLGATRTHTQENISKTDGIEKRS